LVDVVVVDPDQRQGYELIYDPSISGEQQDAKYQSEKPAFSVRLAIARRASLELFKGAVINFGFGIPDQVAALIAQSGESEDYYQTIEHGTYGGNLLTGNLFGYAKNPTCMIDGPSQFDFYSGGGLDVAFLGFGQIDQEGNVNVSKLDGVTVGPGGFIDIAQNAEKVVFCGTFDTKGSKLRTGNGELSVEKPGEIRKLVQQVDQVTFSGKQALKQKQEVIYATERALFRLTEAGLVLEELAPGVELEKDVLQQMDFVPIISQQLKRMDSSFFMEQ